ncbi:MAG TPA: hypothetical protein VFJ72_13090 [Rubrobacteraceae bacterium]|nr:hypothetical protein [Rubrobacteraceae bacterium]
MTRPERAPYWLIADCDGGHFVPFTVMSDGGGEMLPVFGHRDEAGRFLRLAAAEGAWEVRETGAGELVSILSSLCGHVKRVVLDPSPEEGIEVWTELASLGRRSFIESLLEREESAAS